MKSLKSKELSKITVSPSQTVLVVWFLLVGSKSAVCTRGKEWMEKHDDSHLHIQLAAGTVKHVSEIDLLQCHNPIYMDACTKIFSHCCKVNLLCVNHSINF